jgi:hypothetical protein
MTILYLLNYEDIMALLVKEAKALARLEQSFKNYLTIVHGQDPDDLGIDSAKTVEERLLYLSALLDSSY